MNFANKFAFKRLFSCCLVAAFVAFSAVQSANASPKYAALIIDAETGVVLHQENAGQYRYPASLTKMMTAYLTFQALEKGKLRMDQKIRVSSRAASQPPTGLNLKAGSYIKVQDALLAVIIKSANDAAVVLAEAIGGSEWQFATMMNSMAKRLGMEHTTFKNASGLPNRQQRSTAYDLARLAVALRRDYPKHYHYFDRSQFQFNGRVYPTHNRVSKNYPGADGLKTGYIRDSGFNLVTSVRRNGRSLVGVVLGGRTSQRRDKEMIRLLDQSFNKLSKTSVSKASISNSISGKDVPVPSLKPRPHSQADLEGLSIPSPSLKPEVSLKMSNASSG